MIPIETATPEQVADTVCALNRRIGQLETENQRLRQELEGICACQDITDATAAANEMLYRADKALKGGDDASTD